MRFFEVRGSGGAKWKMLPKNLRSLKTMEILIYWPSSTVWLAKASFVFFLHGRQNPKKEKIVTEEGAHEGAESPRD